MSLQVSPWVPRGLVISEPLPAEKPFANSEFELTSVIASVKNLFDSPAAHLTKVRGWCDVGVQQQQCVGVQQQQCVGVQQQCFGVQP